MCHLSECPTQSVVQPLTDVSVTTTAQMSVQSLLAVRYASSLKPNSHPQHYFPWSIELSSTILAPPAAILAVVHGAFLREDSYGMDDPRLQIQVDRGTSQCGTLLIWRPARPSADPRQRARPGGGVLFVSPRRDQSTEGRRAQTSPSNHQWFDRTLRPPGPVCRH